MHFVTIITPGDYLLALLLALAAVSGLFLVIVSLYEKARMRFARFMSGSWWVGPPK